jgi:hypothetical protein
MPASGPAGSGCLLGCLGHREIGVRLLRGFGSIETTLFVRIQFAIPPSGAIAALLRFKLGMLAQEIVQEAGGFRFVVSHDGSPGESGSKKSPAKWKWQQDFTLAAVWVRKLAVRWA